MTFCNHCGAQLPENATFCGACGKPVVKAQSPLQGTVDGQAYTNASSQPNADTATKGYVWLSYVGLLALIPLLTAKDSPNCQFHAKQGLNLAITATIAYTALYIVSGITSAVFGFTGLGVLKVINSIILYLASLGLSAIFIIQTVQGIVASVNLKKRELPLANIIKFIK